MSVEKLGVDILSVEDIHKRSEELVELFQLSYGDDYRGDEKLRKKLEETDQAVILENQRRIGAVALIGDGRIMAPGTLPGVAEMGSRSDRMVRLLEECEGYADWMSIGVQYEKMQTLARRAGMTPESSSYVVSSVLAQVDELDKYEYDYDEAKKLLIQRELEG